MLSMGRLESALPQPSNLFRGRRRRRKGSGRVKLFRTAVSPHEIANLCGPPFTEVDIFEVGDELGLKGAYNRYGRLEARLIIAKLMVRASEPGAVERLLDAYATLVAKTGDQERAK